MEAWAEGEIAALRQAHRLTIEAVLGVQRGDRPGSMYERLVPYLTPGDRDRFDADAAEQTIARHASELDVSAARAGHGWTRTDPDKLRSLADVAALDDRRIQRLLRDVAAADLMLALQVAPEPIRERFLVNVSARVARRLREDSAASRASESQASEAHARIVGCARQLAQSEEI